MNPIKVRELVKNEHEDLVTLYNETKVVRIRTRVQMILLAVEESMAAPQIARLVRKSEDTVRRWIKRFNSEGVNGLYDEPRSGPPSKVTPDYKNRLLQAVRQRPRSLDQPYSLWTLQRLSDYLAEESGLRFSSETVRLILKANDIVISRPQYKISSPDPEYEVKKRRLKPKEIT